MKLLSVVYASGEQDIVIRYVHGGVEDTLVLPVAEMPATGRKQWAEDQVWAYLATHELRPRGVVIFPADPGAPEDATDGFEDLPGWASWTPAEAEEWVLINVIDLQTARQVMAKMARIIVYLRNIVIER